MADEEGVAPSDIHIWPSAERPILAAIYLCPTETYKAAQHASIDHPMSTCQTRPTKSPPRERNKTIQTEQKSSGPSPEPPPRELTDSMQLVSCPTRLMNEQQSSKSASHCPGTRVAPSHRTNASASASKLSNLPHSLTAWDKRQRVGEASNPGPEPPRELYLNRKNGQRDPIRLCTQNGGWVWNVHCVPPLRVAKRSTPHEALRNWLTKHENAIQPASVEAARQLANEWEAFPVPQPARKTRSLPPRG